MYARVALQLLHRQTLWPPLLVLSWRQQLWFGVVCLFLMILPVDSDDMFLCPSYVWRSRLAHLRVPLALSGHVSGRHWLGSMVSCLFVWSHWQRTMISHLYHVLLVMALLIRINELKKETDEEIYSVDFGCEIYLCMI